MTTKISSFALFDLETASLPTYNFNKTNITEISIHSFNVDDVSKLEKKDGPRINHKLTLLFNPLMRIDPEAEKITGLDNFSLEKESKFDVNAANMIINFLRHLQQPVCLVAHNGKNFDFPVLKHAFSKLKMELPTDILCLDSLVAIKYLDTPEDTDINQEPLPNVNLELETLASLSKIEKVDKTPDNDFVKIESFTVVPDKAESPDDWQKFNETTPTRPSNFLSYKLKRKKQTEDESTFNSKKPSSRKSLDFSSTPSEKLKYSLEAIYKRLFGDSPMIAHRAEADVIALEKIVLKYGKSFVDYALENAIPFREVKKLGAV